MDPIQDYIQINKALWDEKTKHHVGSAFYDNDSFLKGASSLKEMEVGLLGDVKGKTILHLQCHFGQDTLSLARMGAKATGADFSGVAIETARELNSKLGLDAEFICTDIYDLPNKLGRQFDIVFTSYGTIGWLPDMERWAAVVSKYVKPGGFFLIVDFHPVMWMYNSDFSGVQYSYFNKEAIIETLTGTYADRDAAIRQQEIGWNHSLAEVFQNLIKRGLRIETFCEFDTSPFNCFQNMIEVSPGRFQIKGMEGKLPMVYAIKATK